MANQEEIIGISIPKIDVMHGIGELSANWPDPSIEDFRRRLKVGSVATGNAVEAQI